MFSKTKSAKLDEVELIVKVFKNGFILLNFGLQLSKSFVKNPAIIMPEFERAAEKSSAIKNAEKRYKQNDFISRVPAYCNPHVSVNERESVNARTSISCCCFV